MNAIVLKYGLAIGGIVSLVTITPMLFGWELEYNTGEIIGYTTMILSTATIFVAIKSYRDDMLDGAISFGHAFKLGFFISLLGGLVFAGATLAFYIGVEPDFAEKYFQHTIEQMTVSGQDTEAIKKAKADWDDNKELYTNPFFNAMLMLMTVFPIGVFVSLISATILKNKEGNR